MIAVVAYVLLVVCCAGLPLAVWTQLPPWRPWRPAWRAVTRFRGSRIARTRLRRAQRRTAARDYGRCA